MKLKLLLLAVIFLTSCEEDGIETKTHYDDGAGLAEQMRRSEAWEYMMWADYYKDSAKISHEIYMNTGIEKYRLDEIRLEDSARAYLRLYCLIVYPNTDTAFKINQP